MSGVETEWSSMMQVLDGFGVGGCEGSQKVSEGSAAPAARFLGVQNCSNKLCDVSWR